MELEKGVLAVIKGGSLAEKVKLLESCYCKPKAELEGELDAAMQAKRAKNWWVKEREKYLEVFKFFDAEAEEICFLLIRDKSVQVRKLAAVRSERLATRIVTRRDSNS